MIVVPIVTPSRMFTNPIPTITPTEIEELVIKLPDAVVYAIIAGIIVAFAVAVVCYIAYSR